jgi:short-subunit dehydrogenase
MIVTGASSGIGRALAIAAARDGYAVLLVARRGDRLEATLREIREAGGTAEALTLDVRARDAAERIVSAATNTFGRVDALVNNAGGGVYGELLTQSDAAIEAQWQTHVAAPLRLARAALPHLERAHGSIVFVGSGVARVPLPAFDAYPLAKAAIRAAAIQLRRELRPRGIAVTYLDPGVAATEFHDSAGVVRPSGIAAVPPERVARAVLRAVRKRAAVANAAPLQTAGTVAGELLGTLVDPVVEKLRMQSVSSDVTPGEASLGEAASNSEPPPAPSSPQTFDDALAPVARRMERVKLPQSFLRDALVPGATLELNELAMRWAGMPNKNERAAMGEVLEALASAGYLEPTGPETWNVIRSAS